MMPTDFLKYTDPAKTGGSFSGSVVDSKWILSGVILSKIQWQVNFYGTRGRESTKNRWPSP
jgi:hypothetical protein